MRHLRLSPAADAFSWIFSARDSRESPACYVYSPGWFACLYCMAHEFGQNCSPQSMGGNYRRERMGITEGLT